MQLSGAVYGGYSSTANCLFSLALLEWRKPFAINYQNRGYFDGWRLVSAAPIIWR